MSTPRRQWTPEAIRAELLPLAAELGRMPKRSELTDRGIGGLWSAMSRNGGVEEWRRLVAEHLATLSVETHAESPVPREQVEVAAFFLALDGHPGTPEEHWLEAERSLRAA